MARTRSKVTPLWLDGGREFIRPEDLRVELGVEDAVMCFTEGFFPEIVKAAGMTRARALPEMGGAIEGKVGPRVAVIRSEVGAPAAGMIAEVLFASGVNRLVMVGLAGSLSPSCPIGSVVIPTWGIREEGTSYHYLEPDEVPTPSDALVETLCGQLNPLRPHKGGIWTIDAPYRETWSKVKAYAKRRAVAVDMETTALMSIAMFRRAEFAAALVISDELHEGVWKQGFHSPELVRARSRLCALVGKMYR